MGQLVLTRRSGQTIVIGRDIVITYLGDKPCRIAIAAPPEISIRRGEIADKPLTVPVEIQREVVRQNERMGWPANWC
jgi:carbon storage regulator CsrA